MQEDVQDNSYRYAIVLEYIGTAFSGSQVQPGQRTVQSELNSALKRINSKEIKTIFSGRTDSGVHSKGQVVHFDLPQQIDTHKYINSLNGLLPEDISVSAMSQVEKTFHAQKSAKIRWYRYKISNTNQRSVWSSATSLVREKLDIKAMNKALNSLVGSHDFSSFRNTNSNNPYTDCTLYSAECFRVDEEIHIDIVGNRFLYNMIRIIVGTLLKVGKGEQNPEYLFKVLQAKDRNVAGPTISPDGLTLMYVGYNNQLNLNESIKKEAHNAKNIFCQAL